MFILKKHTVPADTSHIRLIDYALEVFTIIPSRSSMKKIIRNGALLVNGEKIPSGSWVMEGQEITLYDLEQTPPKPYDLELDIIYEDEHLAVINKPAGIEVSGNKFKTIQNALVSNIEISKEDDALKWARPVHRLDRPTSGLLLVAKTSSSLMHLGQQLEKREIKKKYRAIVSGKIPDNGEITTPINGRQSLTTFNCISRHRSLKTSWISLVDLYPHTGRTHQLRIHMSSLGFPIVGEKNYVVGPILRGKGLFLSAVELSFIHLSTKKALTITVPQPPKFDLLIKREQHQWNKYNKKD